MSKKYKVVLFDLDGTLLNSKKEIFAENVQLLTKCTSNGILVGLATARPLGFLKFILPFELYSKAWKLCHNGAQLFDSNDNCVFSKTIAKESIEKVVDLCQGKCLSVSWYSFSEWLSTRELDNYLRSVYGVSDRYSAPPVRSFDHLKNAGSVEKILVVDHENPNIIFTELMDEISINTTSESNLLMLSAKGTNKKEASAELLNITDTRWEEVIVFGDDHNDICLFKMPCFSVAMANGTANLKELASFITYDNNNPKAFLNVLTDVF